MTEVRDSGYNIQDMTVCKEAWVIDTQWIHEGESLEEAAQLLKEEQVVAFPTETVYGLGAWAQSEKAVKAIYEAKGRPQDNPLIVHVYPGCDLTQYVKHISEKGRALMDAFWPGPLTLSFEKTDAIPDVTTGGLKTVGLRMPDNPVALKLLKMAGIPVAAPSANTSGRPSPTTAQHVYDDMQGRIPCIVDGGSCTVGLESTFIDMSREVPMILRPGAITKEMIEEIIGPVAIDPAVEKGLAIDPNEAPRSPGMKYRHYAPKGELKLVKGPIRKVAGYIEEQIGSRTEKVGVMCSQELLDAMHLPESVHVECLGSLEQPEIMAAGLFAALRNFDEAGCRWIFGEALDDTGVGMAIMNRMQRAASGQIITL